MELIGIIITGIISLINTLLQNKSKEKIEALKIQNEDANNEINEKIDKNQKDLLNLINKNQLSSDRRYLVDFMSRVEAGEVISDEQMRNAFEVKREYNNLGRGYLRRY